MMRADPSARLAMRLRRLFAIALLAATACFADTLYVLPIHYRSADDIVALLSPLLQPDERVSGLAGQLVLSASPARLQELERLVLQFDTPPARLMISVTQDEDARLRERGVGVDGSLVIHERGAGGALLAEIRDRDSLSRDGIAQRVQAVDGSIAEIQLGASRVVPSRGPAGSMLVQASTGFYVRPQLQGTQVTLELAVSREALNRLGGVSGQQLTTTVRGKLGEWINVGGLSQLGSAQSSGLGGHDDRRLQASSHIRLRVERLPD